MRGEDGSAVAVATAAADSGFRPPPRRASSVVSAGGDSVAVRVLVRCRPQAAAAAAKGEATFSFSSESAGPDQNLLRLAVSDGAWDRLAESEDAVAAGSRSGAKVLRTREPKSFKCNAFLGPSGTQEEVFREASQILENVMQGYNGTIFCYGVTGSGKTYTMSGPPEAATSGTPAEGEAAGVTQRVSRRIFEYIRDRSQHGEVYMVEASYLEIYSSDANREQLIDLLADEDRKLEVKQDPLNKDSFVCEGLSRVPIRSPDELCGVLAEGQKRCHFLETTKNCLSSRSHCMLILTVECLSEAAAGSAGQQPSVCRGKLMLVDLAGSESLKRVQAASGGDEDLRRRQAIGINRVLTSLGTVVNNLNMGRVQGHRDSALTMLLRDCLGGNARALLVANVGPELDTMDEASKTMTFAQQMMAVRNVASINHIGSEQSGLVKMRQRHADCIRFLQEKASAAREGEVGAQDRLQREIADLNQRLLTKESASKTLEQLRSEGLRKMDELKNDMAQSMSRALARMRQQGQQGVENIRQSVELQVSSTSGDASQQRHRNEQEHQEELSALREQLADATGAFRVAESEASRLRIGFAAAEVRAGELRARREDLATEDEGQEEERQRWRARAEEQRERQATAESGLEQARAEAEAQAAELTGLREGRAEAEAREEEARAARAAREAELREEARALRARAAEARRGAEVEELRSNTAHRERVSQLQLKLERLRGEAAARAHQLLDAKQAQRIAEEEEEDARQRSEMLRQHADAQLQRVQEELEESRRQEEELLQMLEQVQDTIMSPG